jgi:hypothetical protein
MASNVLSESLSEPLNGATTAKIDINCGYSNLKIDRLSGGEQMLASGTLQYLKKVGPPTRSVRLDNGQAVLTLRGGDAGRSWFRLPWTALKGAIEWQIHLNPTVSSDIAAHSDGGNVRLDLAGMTVTRVSAEAGGGNLDVVLPDNAANLGVAAKTGAGNVTVEVGSGLTGNSIVNVNSGAGNVGVRIPGGIAAKVHAVSGLGKVTVDSRFSKMDGNTYQSSDYNATANKIEITANSGAGNVSVSTK